MKTKKLLSLVLLGILCSVGNAWGGTSVTWAPTEGNVTTLNAETDNLITVGSESNSYIVAATGRLCGTGTGLSWSSNCIQFSNNKLNRGGVAIYFPTGTNNVESITFYLHTSGSRKTYYYSGAALSSSNKPDGTQTSSALSTSSSGYSFDWDTPSTSKTYAVGGYTGGSGNAYLDKIIVVFATSAMPADPTFDPETGSSLSEGSEITLTSTGATTILYQWAASTIGSDGEWGVAETYSDSNKPIVPGYGSSNNILSVKASNAIGSTYGSASYTIIQPQVATPTFTPAARVFDESIDVTIACATEGATILYSTDGVDYDTYTSAIHLTATTTLYTKATKSGYLTSEVTSAEYEKFAKHDIAPISTSKTWTIPTSISLELTTETTPVKYDEYYTYEDIAYLNSNNLGTFDGTTLAFSGQFPYRSSNGAQNGNFQFITTIPGKVTIEFSNTGSSNKKRWVKVNSTIGIVEADGTTHRTEEFSVEAGTVTITHVDGDGNLSNGLRIYSIVFTPTVETITTASGQTYGTYVTSHNLDFSEVSGITAYKVTGVESGVIQTTALDEVPSGTPILIETASAGATVNVPFATSTPGAITGNKLKAGANSIVSDEDNYRYVLAVQGGVTGFYKLASATNVPADKAYLELTVAEAAAAPSWIRIVEEDQNATSVENIKANENVVKFIENGKLLIKKDGIVYDALGRVIR